METINVKTVKPKKRDTPQCPVCDTQYNKSFAAPIQCEYCDFVACRTCCQTYILGQPAPKCMNPAGTCGREWTMHFMRRHLTIKFMSERWRDHRMETLYDMEKSMLPDAQGLIELRQQKDELMKKDLSIRREIRKLEDKLEDNMQYVRAMIERIQHRERTGNDNPALSDPRRRNGGSSASSEQVEAKYVRPCPAGDCRGFLNHLWKCGICKTNVCSKCHEVIEKAEESKEEPEFLEETKEPEHTGHICKPENVQSAKEVMSHSKPCPKCSAFIFKIDGCNQMFCTNCHTAFDWRTRTISSGPIHNPHYFAWLEQNGGNNNNNNVQHYNPCNQDAPHTFAVRLRRTFNRFNGVSRNLTEEVTSRSYFPYYWLSSMIRNLLHLNEVVLVKYRHNRRLCEELRVRFLQKQINETIFKQEVYKLRLNEMKYGEFRQLYEMVSLSSADIVQRMLHHLEVLSNNISETHLLKYNFADDILPFLNEMYRVVEYANVNLAELPVTYGTTTKHWLDYDLSCHSCLKSVTPQLTMKCPE